MECPINLEKNFLGQVFGFIKSSVESMGKIVDAFLIAANHDLPGGEVAIPASGQQFRIGRFQTSDSTSTIKRTKACQQKFHESQFFLR